MKGSSSSRTIPVVPGSFAVTGISRTLFNRVVAPSQRTQVTSHRGHLRLKFGRQLGQLCQITRGPRNLDSGAQIGEPQGADGAGGRLQFVGNRSSVMQTLLPIRFRELGGQLSGAHAERLQELSDELRIGSDQRFEYAHLL